jgi:putative hemolysin
VILKAGSGVFKKSLRRERRALSNDELRTVVEVGEEQGVLAAEEASMVDGIMRLSELKASDEMTPRVDIVGLDLDTPLERQLDVARNARFRHLPAYVRTPDAIEGFVNTVQFLLDAAHDVRKATSPALFIPENVSLDELLITFQRSGKHIACVLDEYGGTAGLITRGDILDLITAPVTKAGTEEQLRKIGDSVWLIDGMVSLEEVNRQLELALDADDADRIAGWITFHAGRLLQAGQTVEAQGCRATIRRMRKRRIDVIQLEVLARDEGASEAGHLGDGTVYESAEDDELS